MVVGGRVEPHESNGLEGFAGDRYAGDMRGVGANADSFCLNQAKGIRGPSSGGLGQFLKTGSCCPNKSVLHHVDMVPTTLGHGNILTHASVEPHTHQGLCYVHRTHMPRPQQVCDLWTLYPLKT